MYRVAEALSERLSAIAESGMGYQLVRVVQKEGSRGDEGHFAILNAEYAIATRPDWRPIHDSDVWPFGDLVWRRRWDPIVATSFPFSDTRGRIREAEPFPYAFDELKVETRGSFRAVSRGEAFYRYSAFPNDRRLRSEDGVIPAGTYLTSHGDTRFAVSGLGAVARYALPNPAPAIFLFAIGVPTGTALMCGTASPSFGQSGGGVELRTDQAVQDAHFYGPEVLPEW